MRQPARYNWIIQHYKVTSIPRQKVRTEEEKETKFDPMKDVKWEYSP